MTMRPFSDARRDRRCAPAPCAVTESCWVDEHRHRDAKFGACLKTVPKKARNGTVGALALPVFRGAPAMSDLVVTTEIRTVVWRPAPPKRQKNAETRPREYLTEAEVDNLIKAARKRGRWGHRDATMILVAFRHGLRVSELVSLRWDQIDFDAGLLHVNRLKNGVPSVHPIGGREMRGLRQIKREQPAGSRYVFMTERGAPFTANG